MTQDSFRTAFAQAYVDNVCGVLRDLPWQPVARLLAELERAHREQRTVFLAGNGGSASTAAHTANDFVRGVSREPGRGLRAISLSDNVSMLTAIANDESDAEVFARPLEALGRPGDVLLVFSGSGNSPNLVRAVSVAKTLQMTAIAVLGMGGGKVAPMVDIAVVVPCSEYEPIEDVHMVLHHLMTAYLRSCLNKTAGDDGRGEQASSTSVREVSDRRGKRIATIIPAAYSKAQGIQFFTPNEYSQQLAFMAWPEGKHIEAHVHNPVSREVQHTLEVLFVRRGRVRADLYDEERQYLESHILGTGDMIFLAAGGHGFKCLEATQMIEVKQGPYVGDQDKTRFQGVSDDEVLQGGDPS